MTLYHGSGVEVKETLLLQNHRELDFGRGFYTTSDIEQAKRWAKRTTQRVKQKQSYVLFVKYLIDNYWEYHQEALENAFTDIDTLFITGKHA